VTTQTSPRRGRPIGAPGDLLANNRSTRGRVSQHTRRGGVLDSVAPGSPAARAGIKAGDIITTVNGHRLRDVVDFQFYAADALVDLGVLRGDKPGVETITILRDTAQDIGLAFQDPTFSPIRECNNHCPFCFIDQLPAEMRTSLYIRDDDYRYSFLYGNFVTLTNLNKRDWVRLAEQKLSPLYVSVHSTDHELRSILLGNSKVPNILDQLDRLAELGIRTHTQIVVCPGLNDGEALEKTIRDLTDRHPNVVSVGVVPVGLTRTPEEILDSPAAACSRILPSARNLNLRQFRTEEATEVIALVESFQRRLRRALGKSVVYASDEFFLLAKTEVPDAAIYDGFPQYENGIGMVRDFLDDWSTRRAGCAPDLRNRKPTVITGKMFAQSLSSTIDEWASWCGADVQVVSLENSFFGPRVTVAGLLTGRDILSAADQFRGDLIVLPAFMLDKTGQRLVDSVTPAELESELGRPVSFAGTMTELTSAVATR
jgi:putative radical SAM enzyme (TIGR03279 family)